MMGWPMSTDHARGNAYESSRKICNLSVSILPPPFILRFLNIEFT